MIIGLGYKKRSGKDSVANRLVDKWGFQKLHLGAPIKLAARELYDLSDAQLYGDLKDKIDPRWNKTPREIFQLLSEECCRSIIDPLTLEKTLAYKYDLTKTDVVIADVRKRESFQFIKDLGGLAWRVDKLTEITDSHISETDLDSWENWDQILLNNKTLNDLYKSVDSIMLNLQDNSNGYNRRKTKSSRDF